MGQPLSFPRGKLPPQRLMRDKRKVITAVVRFAASSAPSARELPAKPAEGESASKRVHSLSSGPLSLCRPRGDTSLTEGGGNKRASACKFAAFRLFCRCGGTFPMGKVGVARLRRSVVGGATFAYALLSRGPRRARLPRAVQSKARICRHLRRQRVQGEGRLCKKPLSLACLSSPSFCTSRKVAPPAGGTHVLIKRITSLQPFGLSLFRRLRRHLPPREGRASPKTAASRP
jgi:hypothetical protein